MTNQGQGLGSGEIAAPEPSGEVTDLSGTSTVAIKFRRGPGNPRLGRETRAEKLKRTGTWRDHNDLWKLEKLHVPGSVHEALGISHKDGTHIGSSGKLDLGLLLDSYDNPSYWR